jgi:hypothetical protein
MSEEKVIQHTENILHTVGNKKLTWRAKVKEVVLEICIISFAVSLTLFLHNWNDGLHERRLAREFLAGIRQDLKIDSARLAYQIGFFKPIVHYYGELRREILENKIDAAYADTNSSNLAVDAHFHFDNGRFESFKSSGYLRLIENQKLSTDLTNLFTVYLPTEVDRDREFFSKRLDDFEKYFIGMRPEIIDSSGNIKVSPLLKDPMIKYEIQINYEVFANKIKQKSEVIGKINQLTAEIGAELDK